MTLEWETLSPEHRDTLNQLLQAAAPEAPEQTWPDVASLWAFVAGTASESVEAQVQAALARSPRLQMAVAEMAASVQPLSESEARTLKRVAVPDPGPLARRLGLASVPSPSPGLWERVRGFLASPVPAYATAAVLAVVAVVPRLAPRVATIQPMVAVSVIAADADEVLRGSDEEAPRLAAAPVSLTIWLPVAAAPAPGAAYRLEVTDADDTLLEQQELPAPARIDGGWASVVTVQGDALPAGDLRFTVVRDHPEDSARRFQVRLRR